MMKRKEKCQSQPKIAERWLCLSSFLQLYFHNNTDKVYLKFNLLLFRLEPYEKSSGVSFVLNFFLLILCL